MCHTLWIDLPRFASWVDTWYQTAVETYENSHLPFFNSDVSKLLLSVVADCKFKYFIQKYLNILDAPSFELVGNLIFCSEN